MMKRLLMVSLFGAAGALTVALAAENPQPPTSTLQLEVLLPASVDPIHSDDVIEIFASSVREAFRRKGYDGRLEELYFSQDAKPELPLLTIRVFQWKRNRTGGIDSTFTAAIRPVDGEEQRLGMFHATESAVTFNRNNPWQVGEAFRDSAERAAEDLWRRLEKLNVVPGIGTPAE